MNNFTFFGKVQEKPQLLESDKGCKYCNIIIGVNRNYKKQDGVELIDDFKITLFQSLAEDVCEKVKKGKGIIISGRLQQNNYNKNENEVYYRPELVGEKVTYTD